VTGNIKNILFISFSFYSNKNMKISITLWRNIIDNSATLFQKENPNLNTFHSYSATRFPCSYLVSYSSVKLHATFQDDTTSGRARRYLVGGRDTFWSRCDSAVCATAKPEFLSDSVSRGCNSRNRPTTSISSTRTFFSPSVLSHSSVTFNRLLDSLRFPFLVNQFKIYIVKMHCPVLITLSL